MKKDPYRHSIIDYFKMITGVCIYSTAIALFLDPNSLAPGGLTGIAMIMNRITGMETGTWILLLNVPILILGLWKFGLRFFLSTVSCIVLVTFFTNYLSGVTPVTGDDFLACVVGSSLLALGIGLVFKGHSTTGGTDIIVKILRQKFPHLKTSGLFLTMDAVIVGASYFVIGDVEKTLYAGICIVITSRVLDVVLYGRDEAKLIYIISDHYEKIASRLLQELDLGVTYVEGVGAYSGRGKKVIMCAVRKQAAPKTEDVVREEDPMAFMIVTSATEIYGEGYKSYFGEKL